MTTFDVEESVGSLRAALASVRQELEGLCEWRRKAPFSPAEQARWQSLAAREQRLIDDVRASRLRPADRDSATHTEHV